MTAISHLASCAVAIGEDCDCGAGSTRTEADAREERKKKHTPTPWEYREAPPREVILKRRHWEFGVRDGLGVGIAFGGPECTDANVAFIVRTCNARDELVVALNGTLALIRKAQERLCSYLGPEGSDDLTELMDDMLELFDGPQQREIESAARAALAKAGG